MQGSEQVMAWCAQARRLLRAGARSPVSHAGPVPAKEAGLPQQPAAFDEAGFRTAWAAARHAWPEALEATGLQIGRLQTVFRATGDPLAAEIADKSLNGLTGQLRTSLQVALFELEGASGPQLSQALRRLREACSSMREFLEADPVLPLLESNPFGVLITIRERLGAALTTLDRVCVGH